MTVNLEREKAKRKIIALLNKTVDRGASESEATSAAEKAGELMAFYDIESGELEFQEKNIVKAKVPYKAYSRREYAQQASMGIAKLCQCRIWRSPWDRTNTFFGFKHDTDIATAMFLFMQESAIRCVEDFQGSDKFQEMVAAGYNKKSIVISFIGGFDSRMYHRLVAMAEEREQRVVLATGTALVPMKEAEIDREMKEQGIRLVSGSSRTRVSAGDAYQAGASAAEGVALSSAVNGGAGGERRLA